MLSSHFVQLCSTSWKDVIFSKAPINRYFTVEENPFISSNCGPFFPKRLEVEKRTWLNRVSKGDKEVSKKDISKYGERRRVAPVYKTLGKQFFLLSLLRTLQRLEAKNHQLVRFRRVEGHPALQCARGVLVWALCTSSMVTNAPFHSHTYSGLETINYMVILRLRKSVWGVRL